MNASKSLSPGKRKEERLVFRLSHPAVMKFRPIKMEDQSASLMEKVRGISKLIPFRASR